MAAKRNAIPLPRVDPEQVRSPHVSTPSMILSGRCGLLHSLGCGCHQRQTSSQRSTISLGSAATRSDLTHPLLHW